MDTENKKNAAEALDVRSGYASVTVIVNASGAPKAAGRNAKEAWGSFDFGYSWRTTRGYYRGICWRAVRYYKHNNRNLPRDE